MFETMITALLCASREATTSTSAQLKITESIGRQAAAEGAPLAGLILGTALARKAILLDAEGRHCQAQRVLDEATLVIEGAALDGCHICRALLVGALVLSADEGCEESAIKLNEIVATVPLADVPSFLAASRRYIDALNMLSYSAVVEEVLLGLKRNSPVAAS